MARGRRAKRWIHSNHIVTTERELSCLLGDMGRMGWEMVGITRKDYEWRVFFKQPRRKMRRWPSWECRLMNLLDFRYWRCECKYVASYGKVIFGDCEKHD